MNLPFHPSLICCLALIALGLASTPANAQINTYNGTKYFPTNTEAAWIVSSYINVRAPIERASDSFTFYFKVPGNNTPSSRSLVAQGLGGNGYGPTSTATCLALYTSPPYSPLSSYPVSEYWVTDTTTHEESAHVYPSGGNTLYIPTITDLRGTTWTLVGTAVPKNFALDVNDHWGHSLLIGSPSAGWSPVTAGLKVGTYQNGNSGSMVQFSTPWFLATASPNVQSYYLADLATDLKSPTGAADARAVSATWSYDPQYNSYPFYNASVTLNACEAGHKFMIHCKIGSAPELQLPTTAALSSGGGSASIASAVPSGVPFWVTRDAENFITPRPVAPSATTTWTATANNQTFSTNVFPQTPNRTLTEHKFRINATNRAGHTFIVQMSDGYTMAMSAEAPEQIPNWLDDGTPAPLPLYCCTANIDPNFNSLLIDTTTGTTLMLANPNADEQHPDTVLDGWSANHGSAPQYLDLTIQLPASRMGDGLSLLNGTTDVKDFTVPSLDTPPIQHFDAIGGMAAYDLPYIAISFDNPLPYLSSFTLSAGSSLDDGQTPTVSAVPDVTNDLRNWLLPPVSRYLQITSSRWGHTLLVRQPNVNSTYPYGESFPITQGDQGEDTTLLGNRHPWSESYYYFNAATILRSELPWYVEDVTTGQRLGPLSTDSETSDTALNTWFYKPAPASLTATDDTNGGVILGWPLGAASRDGSYSLEINTGGGWLVANDNITADSASADAGQFAVPNAPGAYFPDIQYRVQYHYGYQSSDYSPVVDFQWTDSDHDGLPDDWEMQTFGTLAYGLDDDPDHDGLTTRQELSSGGNPNAKDNPVLNLTAFGFTLP